MLSYNETKILIEEVLAIHSNQVRADLYLSLKQIGSDEGEFYKSVAVHAPAMKLTSEQWLDLLSKFPNRIFWSQISINKILSEEQIKKLPPVTG
jgi:hypothetical protein